MPLVDAGAHDCSGQHGLLFGMRKCRVVLAYMVYGKLQFRWALQLSLLMLYIQVHPSIGTYTYQCPLDKYQELIADL